MAALIKGGQLSGIYKWFILRKPKHNNDYLKVTVHYNEHIPFLTVHNLKPYTLAHTCRRYVEVKKNNYASCKSY